MRAASQGSLKAVQKFENTLTSKFGASGTGCCNVCASNFRPAKIHPATGNLNVDNFRIAGLVSRPHARRFHNTTYDITSCYASGTLTVMGGLPDTLQPHKPK